MKTNGFTLIELLIVLVISAIIIFVGIPSLTTQIKNTHTKTAMLDLLRAIESTRSIAVATNNRTLLQAKESDWQKGWQLFIDSNDDGVLNGDEVVSQDKGELSHVRIKANTHLKDYISFIGTGEGRKVGRANGGAFQVGTIKICPAKEGQGFALVLSRGGRTRVKQLTEQECAEI